jgi:hypothetical protein
MVAGFCYIWIYSGETGWLCNSVACQNPLETIAANPQVTQNVLEAASFRAKSATELSHKLHMNGRLNYAVIAL